MRQQPKMVSSRCELFRHDRADETFPGKHQSFQTADAPALNRQERPPGAGTASKRQRGHVRGASISHAFYNFLL
jgi:hypothetical protein